VGITILPKTIVRRRRCQLLILQPKVVFNSSKPAGGMERVAQEEACKGILATAGVYAVLLRPYLHSSFNLCNHRVTTKSGEPVDCVRRSRDRILDTMLIYCLFAPRFEHLERERVIFLKLCGPTGSPSQLSSPGTYKANSCKYGGCRLNWPRSRFEPATFRLTVMCPTTRGKMAPCVWCERA
jgi:hypothetical protein